jgi:phosphatidylglycerophosphatase A
MSESAPPPLSPWHPAALLATWFGSGLLPYAPGTWGSLAALPFAWIIASLWGQWALLGAAGLAFAVGIWAAEIYARRSRGGDPPAVVIDEVAGQWLALAVVPPDSLPYVLGFVLFRVFDIVKPWPAGAIDRRLKSGFGIMLDDMLAGAYAAILLWLIMWALP